MVAKKKKPGQKPKEDIVSDDVLGARFLVAACTAEKGNPLRLKLIDSANGYLHKYGFKIVEVT